ncbi:MAG: 5-methylthioadenosine/S-adenosylhomocysteine deaminase, partial [Solirubrobacteraceae bacterium]|nr:5-methylthioadenosine/S-adenosylhomocysteine deaminase [Solirubrobacteraceae bacterium]
MSSTTAPLLPAPLVVTGHLVTFDEARPQIPDGTLYVDRDGVIVAVAPAADPPPPGFERANRVATGGVVYPGLIDLHNHIAYNCLGLWIAPDRSRPWTARDQWPLDPDYLPSITLPVNALCAANGKAVLKYVETKAVAGGVTAIQGSSKVGRPFEGWMVRNVEYETFRTGVVRVHQAVFPLTEERDFRKVRRQLDAGDAFVYHLCEGTDPALLSDYDALGGHDCLAPRFVGIHCTALGDEQFADWQPRGGSIVWSPFSNLWLYGATTDIAAARARGMRICLGSDWSPSGTKSLLGELKVADLHNREALGGLLSDEEICRMVTCNPADALGWE